ncbi:hypothetical protein MMC11_002874 [Xylographa trunciseda]|nr:hypothetical protein [Xylographa trunciseda]
MTSLRKIIHSKANIDPLISSGTHLESVRGNFQFHNVDFFYPSRPEEMVLKNIDLDFVAGQTTALVGPSGCGKSTITALLGRWYDPCSGNITLDGRNLRDLMSNPSEDTVLFNDTVFSNVAHGLHGTPLEKLVETRQRELVKKAFIEQLPNEYDTHIGVGGNLLSGGQKQRIAIARAIICSLKIFIFDEATSALDPRSETAVESAIQKVCQGRTTVLVTHKLAMAKRAHRIYVLDKGQVVEAGDHESLIRAKGLYKRMHGQQQVISRLDKKKIQPDIEPDSAKEIQGSEKCISHQNLDQRPGDRTHLSSKKGDASFLAVVYALWIENRRIRLLLTASWSASIIGDAVYPAQAVLFAESITVFQSKEDNFQSNSNFWSLLWFVVALSAFCLCMAVGILTSVAGSLTFHAYRNSAMTVLSTLLIAIVSIGSFGRLTLITAWDLALVALFGSLPRDISEALMDNARYASEAVSAIKTIASLTIESAACDELERRMKAPLHYFYKRIFVTMPFFALSQAGNLLGMALAFWYGGNLLTNGEMSAFQIWVVFTAVVSSGEAAAEFFASSNRNDPIRLTPLDADNSRAWPRPRLAGTPSTTYNQPHKPLL